MFKGTCIRLQGGLCAPGDWLLWSVSVGPLPSDFPLSWTSGKQWQEHRGWKKEIEMLFPLGSLPVQPGCGNGYSSAYNSSCQVALSLGTATGLSRF